VCRGSLLPFQRTEDSRKVLMEGHLSGGQGKASF
jgi:hypothetical protein